MEISGGSVLGNLSRLEWGTAASDIYNRIMTPRITWTLTTVPSNEGITLYNYAATYFDEHRQTIVQGQGSTIGQALADLYRHLDQLGYDRSKLPTPKPEPLEEG